MKMLVDRRQVTYSSLQRVESRVGVLIAGTLAAMGLALDKGASVIDVALALGYLRPLYLLLRAFGPLEYRVAPDAAQVEETWPYYPKAVTKAVFQAIGDSVAALQKAIEDKANLTHRSIEVLFRWSVILIVIRVVEGLVLGYGVVPPAIAPLISPRGWATGDVTAHGPKVITAPVQPRMAAPPRPTPKAIQRPRVSLPAGTP